MTKLEKLYSPIQHLKKLGLDLGEDLLKSTSELVQDLIKKEIFLVLSEKIESVVRLIHRKLVLFAGTEVFRA